MNMCDRWKSRLENFAIQGKTLIILLLSISKQIYKWLIRISSMLPNVPFSMNIFMYVAIHLLKMLFTLGKDVDKYQTEFSFLSSV